MPKMRQEQVDRKEIIMVKVESSNISAVGYDTSFGSLIVEYKSGNKYQYKNVPYELYENLLKAESKGRFMNENVKGRFEYDRLVEDIKC